MQLVLSIKNDAWDSFDPTNNWCPNLLSYEETIFTENFKFSHDKYIYVSCALDMFNSPQQSSKAIAWTV